MTILIQVTFQISGWKDFTNRMLNQWYSIYYTYEDRKGSAKSQNRNSHQPQTISATDAIFALKNKYNNNRYIIYKDMTSVEVSNW